MPDHTRTAPVTFQLEPADRLFAAMDALSEDARRRGLTDAIIDEELAAYNAECRERRSIRRS